MVASKYWQHREETRDIVASSAIEHVDISKTLPPLTSEKVYGTGIESQSRPGRANFFQQRFGYKPNQAH